MNPLTVFIIGYTTFLTVAAITIAIVDVKDMNQHAKKMREIQHKLNQLDKKGDLP